MFGVLRRRWNSLGVVGKLSVTLGFMLALVLFVGLVASVALENVRRRTDDVVGRSMHIQRLALELESGIQKARHAEKSFFLRWPSIGFEKARDTHAVHCVELIENAGLICEQLRSALDQAHDSGLEQQAFKLDTALLSECTSRYAASFRESVAVVELLAGQPDGLQPRLTAIADELEALIENEGRDDLLAALRHARVHGTYYFASRGRKHMEKVLAHMSELEVVTARDALLADETKRSFGRMMEDARLLITDILDADARLATFVSESARHVSQLTPMVNDLAASITDDAQGVRSDIGEAATLALVSVGGALFVAVVLAVFIFRLLYASVGRNVLTLSTAARELSRGNLSARARIDSNDEFGKLAVAFNSMAGRINRLVGRLEQQAATASDRLMEAIESISDGFALYDKNDNLVLCNSKYLEIDRKHPEDFRPGASFESIIRSGAHSGVYRDAIGRVEEWVFERMTLHRHPDCSFEQRLSDGRCLLVSEYKTNRGEIVSIVSDITERKRAEEELFTLNADLEEAVRERTKVLVTKTRELQRANRRLMELDEMKSNFLSTVSHELRTPLTSLLGFSKLINRDFTRAFMPKAADEDSRRIGGRIQDNLEIIRSEGERLTRLINDVLDLSRIETGRVEWRDEAMDLASVVKAAAQSVSGEFSQKPEVLLEVGSISSLPVVHADPDRILQVFINLLNNAAKFTEAGTVSIDGKINCHGYVVVRVRDTGVGISPDSIDGIFDKFQQANHGDTLKTATGGSGLGLAICRHIVERYNGHIWAESELGKGTVMTVVLPPECIVTHKSDQKNCTVLVVDDDPAMLDLLGSLLAKEGYCVLYARSGEEALEEARHSRPDLISLDLFMPGMGGREMITRLHEDEELGSIPVLIVSVDEESDTAGGDAVIHKPVNIPKYLESVRSLLGEKKLDRPVFALTDQGTPIRGVCVENIHYCGEDELLALLDDDFDGAVVVSGAPSSPVNLDRIGRTRTIQFMAIPGRSGNE